MKALSIRQPFASLILAGKKTIETRNWATKYRGPLLICSGVSLHNGIVIEGGVASSAAMFAKGNNMWSWDLRGVSLCVVDLIDCHEMFPNDCEAAYCQWYPEHLHGNWQTFDRCEHLMLPGNSDCLKCQTKESSTCKLFHSGIIQQYGCCKMSIPLF